MLHSGSIDEGTYCAISLAELRHKRDRRGGKRKREEGGRGGRGGEGGGKETMLVNVQFRIQKGHTLHFP